MIAGVDFSYGRPGGAALVKAGQHFVVRYITGARGKALTAAEIADYRAHGLAIALVFESTASRALSGYAAGVTDAKASVTRMANLGMPAIPIYFAVDFDASTTQLSVIDKYLAGAASVIGKARVGVYGEYSVMVHCAAARTASWFWQTRAWSAGRVYSGNHLYQYLTGSTGAQPINGAAVDYNRAYKADYGQWALLPDTDAGGTPVGLTINLAVTHDSNPYDALGTAKIVGTGKYATRVGDGVTVPLSDGSDLGVVQRGALASGAALVAFNLAGALAVVGLSNVTFTPLTAPVTDCTAAVAAAVAEAQTETRFAVARAVEAERDRIAQAEAARIRGI